jgi:hypothetical protein
MDRKRLILTAAAALFPIMFAGNLHAGYPGYQNYPGSFCRADNFGGPNPEDWPKYYIVGMGVFDRSAEGQLLVCPIVRDLASFSTGGMAGAIWVVNSPFSPLTLNCTSEARLPGGSLLYGSAVYAAGTGNQTLTMTGPTTTQTFAYRYYICHVPGTSNADDYSGIYSYRSTEQ